MADTFWAGTNIAEIDATQQWLLLGFRGSDFCFSIAIDTKDQAIEWLATDYKVEPVGGF